MTTTSITQLIAYDDFDLAKRKFLDAAYDTANWGIIKEATTQATVFATKDKNAINSAIDALLHSFANNSVAKPEPKKYVSLVDIEKRYKRGNFSFQSLSTSINGGDIVGLVGENGNGKTTLLRLIGGELLPNEGQLDYAILQDKSLYKIKHEIAYVPQRIPRWYGKLKDNLHFAATISGIKNEENDIIVNFMLERFDLKVYENLTWDQISSGYKTRFEIARVLINRPQLLLLDEPLANLDINAQQTLLNDLKELAQSNRSPMAVVLSSQQLFEVEKVATSVIFLKKGTAILQDNSIAQEATTTAIKETIIEVEIKDSREKLTELLGNAIQINFNGNYYTIKSNTTTANELLQKMLNYGIAISYFRDITNSTKRFF